MKNVPQIPITYKLVSNEHKSLSTLAKKLLNIPASTTQLDRVFSQWSFIHTPLRNRLSVESSKKLLYYVYYTLKLKDENKCSDY